MRKLQIALVLSVLSSLPAMADWTGKDASGTTITFKNPNTCSSVVCVPIAQPVDSTGAAFGVTGNPFYFLFGTGATLPGFAATPTFNLGTLNGAATAAKQPALGTAGTPSTDVISVQGVSGGTPQPVTLASGANIAGKFGIDQTTPGTTNGVVVNSSALPTGASTSANQTSQITQETATASGVGTPTDSPASLPASSTSASMIALLKALANTGQYPSGATAITASATGTTAATTATLAGAVGKTTFICSLSIRANATAAATGNATVTGTITGTLNYNQWTAPNTSGVGIVEQIFSPCVPASTTNTGIAVISAAPGTGGVVSVSATGYQL